MLIIPLNNWRKLQASLSVQVTEGTDVPGLLCTAQCGEIPAEKDSEKCMESQIENPLGCILSYYPGTY